MMKLPVEIQLDQTTLRLGEKVSGYFIWQPKDPDRLPKKAEVSIFWKTEGRGKGDRQVVASQALDPNMVLNMQRRQYAFALDLPEDAPITYDGFLFRLMWEVEVRIDFPGLFSGADREAFCFQVVAH